MIKKPRGRPALESLSSVICIAIPSKIKASVEQGRARISDSIAPLSRAEYIRLAVLQEFKRMQGADYSLSGRITLYRASLSMLTVTESIRLRFAFNFDNDLRVKVDDLVNKSEFDANFSRSEFICLCLFFFTGE